MTSCRSLGALHQRLVRGIRWLGLDRNPLRRAVDRAETAVRLGLADAGDFVDPPPGHSEIVGNVFMSVVLAGLCLLALLIAAEAVAHHLLERRRMKAWDTGWRTVAPRWTGYRT